MSGPSTDEAALAVFVERFEGPSALVLKPAEARGPVTGEVCIDVHAAGVNFPDLLVSKGLYQDLYPLPFIMGKEGAGIVRAVGSGVANVKVGDRVAFHLDAGAFSERVVVPSAYCYPIPASVELQDAAGLVLAYQTAYFALTDRGRLESQEWVLVLGAGGGVGVAALQLARTMGARVIAGINGRKKRKFVRAHGAEFVVDLAAAGLSCQLRAGIQELTRGHGIDLVIDTTGGASFYAALRTLAPGGRLIVVGFTSGSIPSVKANYLLLKHISVVGLNWGVYREMHPGRVAGAQQHIFQLVKSGDIRSPVSKTYGMADVSAALHALERREIRGKVVLTTRHLRKNAISSSRSSGCI